MSHPIKILIPISIPAFREEGDRIQWSEEIGEIYISIPAFREEGDPAFLERNPLLPEFQSPPSVRKATSSCCKAQAMGFNFNPRLP